MKGPSRIGTEASAGVALGKMVGGNAPFFLALACFLALNALLAGNAPVSKGKETFLGLYAASFLLFLACYLFFPSSLPDRVQWGIILGGSVLARLFFVPTTPLDDLNRYVWDGYVFQHGWNPYLTYPDDPRLLELGGSLPEVWPGIKHRTASGCYPPLATLIFSLGAWISPTLLCFKFLVLSFDLATILLLGLMLRRRELPLRGLLLYAFNPLVLIFLAGEGHLDSIQGFFLISALFLMATGKNALGFVALGCAGMSKYFSLVATPFLIRGANWRSAPLLFLVPFLSYLPFWDTGMRLFTSLGDFVTYYSFNDPLNQFFRLFLGDSSLVGLAGLLAVCLATVYFLEQDPVRGVYLALGSVLACMPIFNPWYLLWITPFLALFPSRGWLYLHLAIVPASHMASLGLVEQTIPWILLEFVPFAGLLLWDTFLRRRSPSGSSFPPVESLSVVIPTLNEESSVERALKTLSLRPKLAEIIVADGGSSDGTIRVAEAYGAKVVSSPRGRGVQIRAGVQGAQGDVVLVLHADCILNEAVETHILNALNKNPQAAGGSLGMSYEGGSLGLKALAVINNLRARLTGISFGDQGQFFRRKQLESVGGFPPFMLMEDVELSLRLKGIGALLHIQDGVMVSPRRWERKPMIAASLRIVWLVALFLLQRRWGILDDSCHSFYQSYYGKKAPSEDF